MRDSSTARAMQEEALSRAVGSQALTNYATIYQEFGARGIPEEAIQPRINVFTFHAWKALGRSVKRGEHGVRVVTWIPVPAKIADDWTETRKAGKRCKIAYVFHVSQTEGHESRSTLEAAERAWARKGGEVTR